MSDSHLTYLSLGSNIEPGINLPAAIKSLAEHGEIVKSSSIWESEPVGGVGPNYWNMCVIFKSVFTVQELKKNIINPIESRLGRRRNADKYAPRTIDIDIVLFDGESLRDENWNLAFVVVPLTEIAPEVQNPITRELIKETATRLRRDIWLERRRDVLG